MTGSLQRTWVSHSFSQIICRLLVLWFSKELGKGCASVMHEWRRCLYHQGMKCATVVSNYLSWKVHTRVRVCAEVVSDVQCCCAALGVSRAAVLRCVLLPSWRMLVSLATFDCRFLSVLFWAVSLSPFLSPPLDSEHSEGAGVRP